MIDKNTFLTIIALIAIFSAISGLVGYKIGKNKGLKNCNSTCNNNAPNCTNSCADCSLNSSDVSCNDTSCSCTPPSCSSTLKQTQIKFSTNTNTSLNDSVDLIAYLLTGTDSSGPFSYLMIPAQPNIFNFNNTTTVDKLTSDANSDLSFSYTICQWVIWNTCGSPLAVSITIEPSSSSGSSVVIFETLTSNSYVAIAPHLVLPSSLCSATPQSTGPLDIFISLVSALPSTEPKRTCPST